MNRIFLSGLLLITPALFSSCRTNGDVTVGGVPGWLAAGAILESEPPPLKPDPAMLRFESQSGPLQFQVVTDQREYKKPKATTKKRSSTATTRDPIERGRDSRIKRLFR